ncbi:MAG: hypothetical protein U0797_16170 [Gemmataceae bacterium]
MPFVECDVSAAARRSADPRRLYVGSEEGVFVSRDAADSWERLPALPRMRVVAAVRAGRPPAGGDLPRRCVPLCRRRQVLEPG